MIIVLIGPTCVGKTTIAMELIKKISDLRLTLSCTSRNKRNDEIEGKEYYFISEKEFETKIDNNEFIEWENVHNKYYGTLKDEFKHGAVISILDTKGANTIKSKYPAAKTIFLVPPNLEVLMKRLEKRGLSESEIIHRYYTARNEIEEADNYDYLVINDYLELAIEKITNIILNGEQNVSFEKGIA